MRTFLYTCIMELKEGCANCAFLTKTMGGFPVLCANCALRSPNIITGLILVVYISLGQHYHVSPVNICWLRHSTDACLDINLVFCYHIFTHPFNMYVYCTLYDTWIF